MRGLTPPTAQAQGLLGSRAQAPGRQDSVAPDQQLTLRPSKFAFKGALPSRRVALLVLLQVAGSIAPLHQLRPACNP